MCSNTIFFSRPTWIEINKAAIVNNLNNITKIILQNKTYSNQQFNKKSICAIIKSNGYGHGIEQVGKVVSKFPLVKYLGVTSVEEGIKLREQKIHKPILLLGSIFPYKNFSEIIHYDITPTVASITVMKELAKQAEKYNKPVKFHLKVDTGMGRIGISVESLHFFVEEYKKLKSVVCEGVYTHFSSAYEDKEYTMFQLDLFKNFYTGLMSYEIKPLYIHAANSAALVLYPQTHFNMVRPGLIIYGMKPFPEVDRFVSVEPVLSLKSRIVFLKTLPKGKYISYAKTFRTKRLTRVATIPIGYADGFLRKLSNTAKVLVRGQRCNVIGRVTMDMIMVDVTDVKNVCVGDEVVLIGKQGNEQIFIEDIAQLCQTINYEIATLLSTRIPRIVV